MTKETKSTALGCGAIGLFTVLLLGIGYGYDVEACKIIGDIAAGLVGLGIGGMILS